MYIDFASIGKVLIDLGIIVGVPVIRSAAGWAEKALQDHKVVRFEWKKLIRTVTKVGTMGLMGYFGLNLAGYDNAAFAAALGSFFADKVFDSLKESKAVRG